MTRTRILSPAAVIFVLILGSVWFLLIREENRLASTAQRAVEPPDDGILATVWFHDQDGGHWAYIDRRGKVVYSRPLSQGDILGLLSEEHSFSEGLAAESITGHRFGYIDAAGEMVIPEQFFMAGRFSQQRAQVVLDIKDLRSGFIDTCGKIVIPAQYAAADRFSEGLAPVQPRTDSKWGFIDRSGNMVIPPIFDHAEDFSEGLAIVTIGGKDGYIDHAGKIVIPTSFYEALPFVDGRARVALTQHGSHKYGYIDKKGNLIIADAFDKAESFSEGLAPVFLCPPAGCTVEPGKAPNTDGTWGYIDTSGKIVIPAHFTRADRFSDGLAAVVDADDVCNGHYVNLFGEFMGIVNRVHADDACNGEYINKKGEVVIVTAVEHKSFSHGLAAVGGGGAAGFIDKTGKFVIPPRFVHAMPFTR